MALRHKYIDRMARPISQESAEDEIRGEARMIWDACPALRKQYPIFQRFALDLIAGKVDMDNLDAE